ncbi:putative lipoprotein precursor (RlpA-like) [Novosphingobium sp. Rr 2-17]|uniref:septal ring lytic transglycosylase RlpA family protein n=1 Tax=Novosphingobium sp. Rr 2-17 TaxID=555793 RepID=UPI0002699E60|nr:septal ring lytic transglycosylase RlpA family protein [Novosphingobium sp. Rr 2-17]EIZ80819.1 putative lipoprotein precursor (RlpA-like) [Novosphingobium sp. Rr 2-17]
MLVPTASRLAAIVVATLLPLAGPAQADSRIIPVAVIAAVTPDVAPSTLPVVSQPQTPAQTIEGGVASFYGRHLAGARTASGQRFNPDALTAAHRTLAFGTKVQVTNPKTGDTVVVTINDRGPFHSNRVIDLSDAAAQQVGILRAGSGRVELAVLSSDD